MLAPKTQYILAWYFSTLYHSLLPFILGILNIREDVVTIKH